MANEYQDLVKIAEPVKVWTPDGYYEAPTLIDMHKMPEGDLAQQILEAWLRNPKQRILTSGEWHQINETAKRTNPELSESMVELGHGYERTCTLLDYEHGELHLNGQYQYYDGFLIQLPEIVLEGPHSAPIVNADGNGIVRGRHRWRMMLPLEPYFAERMPEIFDTFLNTIYGTENARAKYPGAYICLGFSHAGGVDVPYKIPYGLINIIRGWYNDRFSQASTVWGSQDDHLSRKGRHARAAAEERKK